MEATIEQDLSKAMAGIREQFRQQFEDNGVAPGTAEEQLRLAAGAAAAAIARADMEAGGDAQSEANAAQGELGGLVRLRRDLEAERARQSSSTKDANVERELEQLQVAAAETALTDIRKDLLLQQSAISDVQKDLAGHQEQQARHVKALEQALMVLREELEVVRAHRFAVAEYPSGQSQDMGALIQRFEVIENFSQKVADAAAAKIDQLEARINADAAEAEQMKVTFTESIAAEEAARIGDFKGLQEVVEGFMTQQANISNTLVQELASLRELLPGAAAPEQPAAVESSANAGDLQELWAEANRLQETLQAEKASRSQELEVLSGHFAESLNDVRSHVANELTYCQQVVEELQRSVAKAELPSSPARDAVSNGVELSNHIEALTSALQQEHTERVNEASELRSLLKEVQVCAPTALELGSGVDKEELLQALSGTVDTIRQDLSEEISTQVSAGSSALKGHVAVGCAELRGELTARLEMLESDAASHERLRNRVEVMESELREVLRLTRTLVAAPTSQLEKSPGASGSRRAAGSNFQSAGDSRTNSAVPPPEDAPQAAAPPLISGDLKESLERLVEKVNLTLNPDGDEAQSPLPLLSNTSDHSGVARIFPSRSSFQPGSGQALPVRLVARSANAPATASNSHMVSRLLSQPSQVVVADDNNFQDEASVVMLREKVREALLQQQEPLGPSATVQPAAGRSSSRGPHPTMLQPAQAQVSAMLHAPRSEGSVQSGSYTAPLRFDSYQGQAVPRTYSPVATHRGVSPVMLRPNAAASTGSVQRTVSPVRTVQLL